MHHRWHEMTWRAHVKVRLEERCCGVSLFARRRHYLRPFREGSLTLNVTLLGAAVGESYSRADTELDPLCIVSAVH